MKLTNPILPYTHDFAKLDKQPHEPNLKAICVFSALGFFFDDDTYWKDITCLDPAHEHTINEDGFLVKSEKKFNWYYNPNKLKFEETVEAYEALLTQIVKEQVKDNTVILPLSGGLDSRSQAAVLSKIGNPVNAFSYAFAGGYPEHKISEQIAKVCNFNFQKFTIEKGYLWNKIEDLAKINQCYSEFTHPRQMAVIDDLKKLKGVFSLGHWGDVLFDKGAGASVTENDIIPLLFEKMVKKKGLELAEKLWQCWNLEGNFKDYLISRLETALSTIKIDDVSAKVRAFKTTYWAHRWTTTNLNVFSANHDITLPYYDDRMLEFICTVPEQYLANRKIQIAHLQKNKQLAQITWHAQKPFNIYNYKKNKSPYNLPYRVVNKLQREFNALIGKPYIQRNWELQFLGEENEKNLKAYLYNSTFNNFVPKDIIDEFYTGFKEQDAVQNSHAVSILLTLSVWNKNKK